MVEHVVLVIHLAVQVLHADRDLLVLGMRLHLVEERDAVVGPFRDRPCRCGCPRNVMMLGTPLAAASSMAGVHEPAEPLVVLLAIERDRDGAAGAAGYMDGTRPYFFSSRPIGRPDQVEALDAEARRLAAAVLERIRPAPKTPRVTPCLIRPFSLGAAGGAEGV